MAIGAHGNDGNGDNSGHVRVYNFDGNAWVQQGADIDGEAAGDRSGLAVSLSSDGTTVAIGAYGNDGNGADSGHVCVYNFDGTAWVQQGADIDGEAAGDRVGSGGVSVSLSSDGSTVAIGARGNDGINGADSGHVRVFVRAPTEAATSGVCAPALTVAAAKVKAEAAGLTFMGSNPAWTCKGLYTYPGETRAWFGPGGTEAEMTGATDLPHLRIRVEVCAHGGACIDSSSGLCDCTEDFTGDNCLTQANSSLCAPALTEAAAKAKAEAAGLTFMGSNPAWTKGLYTYPGETGAWFGTGGTVAEMTAATGLGHQRIRVVVPEHKC